MRPPVDITAARTKAGLRPCPAPSPRGQGPSSLRGLWVTCLGDGSRIDLGAALAGHTTVVNLWASWCEVCRKELPVLDAYARSPGAAHVLGVQILSDPADGLDLLAALGVHLPSVLDADNTVTTALRAPPYLPVSYLVTPDGTIRQVLPPTPFTSPAHVEQTVRTMTAGTH
ncbi:MAG: TlpA family protein disulfide reductase [Pseudonocardiaceae bacterium]